MPKLNSVILLFLLFSPYAFSSPTDLENVRNPLTVKSAQPISAEAEAEDLFPVTLNMSLAKGFHGYQDKLKIFILEPDNTSVGDIIISPVVTFVDFAKKTHTGFENEFTLKFFVQLSPHHEGDIQKLKLDIEYVACTEKFCLPRNRISTEVPVVTKTHDTNTSAVSPKSVNIFSNIEENIQSHFLLALLLIFFVGFLTSLTPCVYPLIPITLAVVGARSTGKEKPNQKRAFILSCIYVLGIALTYSILGVIAARTGAIFGQLLTYKPVILFFAFLFFTMGLSMFGVFEVAVPAHLFSRFEKAAGQKSAISAFISGLLAGVVAGPCIGPVLAGVLAYIARTQDSLLGFIMLFTFALGMGVLFIVIGTFSGFLGKLPRSGPWMNMVKFLLGAMMFGLSFYYLQPVVSATLAAFILGIYISLAALFLYSLSSPTSRFAWGIFAIVVLGSVVLSGAYVHQPQQDKSTSTEANAENDRWQPYSEELLAKAKSEGKPVIIDFFADWCGACVELDENTFSTEAFKNATTDFYLLRVDATEPFAGLEALQRKYDVYGLPTIIFISRRGEYIKDLSLTGFEDVEPFLERVKTIEKK